jgi:hypothetical protein
MVTEAIAEIARLRTEAQDLLGALSKEPPTEDETLLASQDRVVQLATDLINAAKQPVTLGIVGEFSSGKSMLLGTLLGRPGLLPTDQRPTTGNVTALHLLPGDEGLGTGFEGDVTITYMSRFELTACVRYMLDEFVRRIRESFPGADVAALIDCDPVNKDWRGLETWCRANLFGGGSTNPGHRQIVAELMAIRDAQLSAGDLLGLPVPVADKLIREALDLGDEKPVPDVFPERNFRPGITRDSIARDGEDLRATFPLIKRVAYRVRVDPGVWPLDGLKDENEVVLLDFPGLTAGRSALRDEYLSRNELHDIHTITVIINADKPGTDVPFKFYAMMERHDREGIGREPRELRESILVVGNQFDRIDAPRPPQDGPLSICDLRELSQQLDGLCIKASDLVEHQDSKIRLTSSIIAMSRSGEPGDFRGEESEKVRTALAAAPARAAAWAVLAARIAATDPAEPWGAALTELAADGGMAAVRQMIEAHARAHGIENKLGAMRRTHKRMWAEVEKLARLIRATRPGAVSHAEESVQQRIGELLEEFRIRHRLVADAVRVLGDPKKLLRPDGEPLAESVRDDAVTGVMRWREWHLILQRCNHGYVDKYGAEPAGPWGDEDDEEEDRGFFGTRMIGNETTKTFLLPYRKELSAAIRSARKGLEEAAQHWIEQRNEQLGDLAERFAEPQVRRLLEESLPRISADYGDADLFRVLERLTDLSWLSGQVARITAATVADEDIDQGYPLYVDRALPWHSDVPERDDDLEQKLARHEFYVLRLQRQLADGVADTVVQRVADDLDRLRSGLERRLDRYWRSIPGAADLRIMFPPDPPAADTADTDPAGGPPGGSALLDFIARREVR